MCHSRSIRVPLALSLILVLLCAAARLTSVFVVGDSISMQYGPYLENHLRSFATYARKLDDGGSPADRDVPRDANGGDSGMVLAYLTARSRDPGFRPDVLVVNAGLHDIKRDPRTGTIQVEADDYRRNLEGIYALSQRIGARLIWVTTTPVDDERHNSLSRSFHRFDRDRAAYDAIAREVMSSHGVHIIDLYSFTRGLAGDHYADHVHFDEETRALQAAFIAGALQALL